MKVNYLFSDESPGFRRPFQPDVGEPVIIRFRASSEDVPNLRIYLVFGKKKRILHRVGSEGALALYEILVPAPEEDFSYCFEIQELLAGPEKELETTRRGVLRRIVYYSRAGASDQKPDPEDMFVIRPGYRVPDWLPGAVMYQIFTDRFCNGDPSNDVLDGEYVYLNNKQVVAVKDWDSLPEVSDVSRFYGGDLQGILDKLDYLQTLGVQVIYLNPIFVSPSNHKYDGQDYDHIDPHLAIIVKDEGRLLPPGAASNAGAERYRCRVTSRENLEASDRFFADFVEEIHRRGMKIILDGVFNHCGSFHKWLDRPGFYKKPGMPEEDMGAWQSKKSRYREYFLFEKENVYESWWGLDTLPKLNYEGSAALQEEVLRIGEKWVSPPFNADGWRLDVAADLGHTPAFNHYFWQRFRKRVKAANPDAVILAEHYGNVAPWLSGGEWDTVMNYDAFMEPVSWFLTGMDKHSDKARPELLGDAETFLASMRHCGRSFGGASLLGAMNQLDNHDHSRFLTRTNKTVGRLGSKDSAAASAGVSKGILRQAVVMQMTWPGAPTLYYGDETGLCGWTDPDNRRSFPWGKEDWDLIEFYRYVIDTHRQHACLQLGSLVPLLAGKHLLAYGRCLKNDRILVVVNTSSDTQKAEVDTLPLGCAVGASFERIMSTDRDGYNVGRKKIEGRNGRIVLDMKPVSSMILREETGR